MGNGLIVSSISNRKEKFSEGRNYEVVAEKQKILEKSENLLRTLSKNELAWLWKRTLDFLSTHVRIGFSVEAAATISIIVARSIWCSVITFAKAGVRLRILSN